MMIDARNVAYASTAQPAGLAAQSSNLEPSPAIETPMSQHIGDMHRAIECASTNLERLYRVRSRLNGAGQPPVPNSSKTDEPAVFGAIPVLQALDTKLSGIIAETANLISDLDTLA